MFFSVDLNSENLYKTFMRSENIINVVKKKVLPDPIIDYLVDKKHITKEKQTSLYDQDMSSRMESLFAILLRRYCIKT